MNSDLRDRTLISALLSLVMLVVVFTGWILQLAHTQQLIKQFEKRIEQAEQNSLRSVDMQVRNNDAIGAEIRRINKKLDMELFGWH